MLSSLDPEDLAVVRTADEMTDLLVAGKGLFKLGASELSAPKFESITSQGVFSSVKELRVSTTSTGTSVWATNVNDGIGYLTADTKTPLAGALPVQVVPDYQGGRFAPFKSTPSACETFVYADKNGNIFMLEQGEKSQLWKPVPIVQPSLDQATEVQSYVTQIKAMGVDGHPLSNHPVILSCSVDTSIIANGRNVLATTAGVKIITDQNAFINLTIPAVDIAAPIFSVSDAAPLVSGAPMGAIPMHVDPAIKIHQTLSKIKNKEDLDIDLGQGKGKLLDGTKLKPEEVQKVAEQIHATMKARDTVLKGVTNITSTKEPFPESRGYNSESAAEPVSSGFTDMLWVS
jgi:hypothetical protein